VAGSCDQLSLAGGIHCCDVIDYKIQFNGFDALRTQHQLHAFDVSSQWSFPMSNTLAKVRVRALEPGELSKARYLGDAGMAGGDEQPLNWGRIAVLIAVGLPVFGGLYYSLLNFLLFG
jgi:hypothetical protein